MTDGKRVPCTDCGRSTQTPNSQGVCPACIAREIQRLSADIRADFRDIAFNWLTVRFRRENGGWRTAVEYHRYGALKPAVGLVSTFDDHDLAVARFRELIWKALQDSGWMPVWDGDRRYVDPRCAMCGEVTPW